MARYAAAVTDESILSFLDATFAFACERRVADVVDVDRLLAAIDAAASEPRLARWVSRLWAPARARLLERAGKSELLLGVWLPEPVRDALADLLGRPAPLPRPLIDKLVADEHVRDSARAMLQEALSQFIAKAFAVAPGGRGLRGVLGLGARAAGGLFGGLGEELQRQLEERVRDFVDGGVTLMMERGKQKVTSDETARLFGQRRRALFLELLRQPESQAARLVARLPWAELDAMLPSVVRHNLGRAELRVAVREELSAVVAELSAQTVGELLDELGLRTQTAEWLRAHGLPLARAFLASPHAARLAPS